MSKRHYCVSVTDGLHSLLKARSEETGISMGELIAEATKNLAMPPRLQVPPPACIHGWPTRHPIGPCPHCTDARLV